MQGQVVLVVVLGAMELLQRLNLRDDGFGELTRAGQLLHLGLRHLLLFRAGVKNGGAVLAANIWALAVELRGVVRDAKKYLQQFLISHLRWVELHAHRLGVTAIAAADLAVGGFASVAAGVTGLDLHHTL